MLQAKMHNDFRDWRIRLLKGSKFCLISSNIDGVRRVARNVGGQLSVFTQDRWDTEETN